MISGGDNNHGLEAVLQAPAGKDTAFRFSPIGSPRNLLNGLNTKAR